MPAFTLESPLRMATDFEKAELKNGTGSPLNRLNKELQEEISRPPAVVRQGLAKGCSNSQTPCGVKEEKCRHAKIAAMTMTRPFRL
jgi:hypothetical protein